MSRRGARLALAVVLIGVLAAGVLVTLLPAAVIGKTTLIAYFDNSNGIYPGDDVRILGVPVGKITAIEPQPQRAKITFWVDDHYSVPAEARAVILSPSLVSSRAVELTPVYTGGPTMPSGTVIPRERTAVPVEWDDLRVQLQKLSQTLQPTQPGGVSTLGAFVNTVADNLRGQGGGIRDTVIKLSQTLATLGDHSGDLFATVENLSLLVSALRDSTGLMQQLNQNLAAVSSLLASDPDEVGQAVNDVNTAVSDLNGFVAENRAAIGTASDKLAEVGAALGESLDDIKQALHVFPTTLANYNNIYEPAQSGITGALAGTNFNNPVSFICGAIQAASRMNAEQSAKLCAQYLAPIVKNRQYNFLGPFGMDPLVGAQARPNEVTYSEDWLRPDYVPPALPAGPPAAAAVFPAETNSESAPVATDLGPVATTTDPSAGLPGLMVPAGGGS
jgi:phospholipid/cholesterol/gamma-HCH transport system substrate-binding protein